MFSLPLELGSSSYMPIIHKFVLFRVPFIAWHFTAYSSYFIFVFECSSFSTLYLSSNVLSPPWSILFVKISTQFFLLYYFKLKYKFSSKTDSVPGLQRWSINEHLPRRNLQMASPCKIKISFHQMSSKFLSLNI